jgi:hypothetical protein
VKNSHSLFIFEFEHYPNITMRFFPTKPGEDSNTTPFRCFVPTRPTWLASHALRTLVNTHAGCAQKNRPSCDGLAKEEELKKKLFAYIQRIQEKILHICGALTLLKQRRNYPLGKNKNNIHQPQTSISGFH